MQTIPNRIIIYPKDIVNITGHKERTARLILSRIRKHLGKQPRDPITIDEYCTYHNLNPETMKPFLR
jgi:hypothetical protein